MVLNQPLRFYYHLILSDTIWQDKTTGAGQWA